MKRGHRIATVSAVVLLGGVVLLLLISGPATDPTRLGGALLPGGVEARTEPWVEAGDDGRFAVRWPEAARPSSRRLALDDVGVALGRSLDDAGLGDPVRAGGADVAYIHFPRVHDGAVVFDQRVTVTEADGVVERVRGRLRDVDVRGVRGLDADDAALVARDAFSTRRTGPPLALLVPEDDGRYRHVWAMDVVALPEGAWRVWVDASDGTVIDQTPLLYDASAIVQVFDENPEDGPLEERRLDALAEPGVLAGLDWTLVDREHEDECPLEEPDSRFLYDPNDWRFTLAMVFEHLDEAEALQSVAVPDGAFEGLPYEVRVDVNIRPSDPLWGDHAFNAFHALIQPPMGEPYHQFGFGAGGGVGPNHHNNFGHDSDVIHHEYGHAATSILTLFHDGDCGITDPEFRALHEGLSDYAAIAANDDPVIGEWPAYPEPIRDVTEPRRYPDDVVAGNPHATGLIAGSAGWAIRQAVGPYVADAVVLGSRVHFAGGDCGFAAWAEGVLAVDEDHHSGRYSVPLAEVLDRHGLLEQDGAPSVDPVVIEGGEQAGTAVVVQSRARSDAGPILGTRWRLIDAPPEAAFELSPDAELDPELVFHPDVEGTWTFDVRVIDAARRLSPIETISIDVGAGVGCGG